MKTTTTAALSESTMSTTHLPQQRSFAFGDGFRQFLASSPAIEDEAPEPIKQPTRFLEAVPATSVDSLLNRKFCSAQDSIARCLTTSLLLAARPTRRSPSLAEAVAALKNRTAQL